MLQEVIADRSSEMARNHRLQMEKCDILQDNWRLIERHQQIVAENSNLANRVEILEICLKENLRISDENALISTQNTSPRACSTPSFGKEVRLFWMGAFKTWTLVCL